MSLVPKIADFLATLRLLPDDIVLDMAAREIEPTDYETCIVGWSFRETLAKASGSPADDHKAPPFLDRPQGQTMSEALSNTYGGSPLDWEWVYYGIVGKTPLSLGGFPSHPSPARRIETAFVLRVLEAVETK